MITWKQNLILIDTTDTGELQPFLNEECWCWNEVLKECATDIRITDVLWNPGENATFDSYNIRYQKANLRTDTSAPWGNAYISGDVNDILAAYVLIDIDAITLQGWGAEAIKWVTGHEMGHVLGLPHTEATPALMFPIADVHDYAQPYQADIDALKNLYGSKDGAKS